MQGNFHAPGLGIAAAAAHLLGLFKFNLLRGHTCSLERLADLDGALLRKRCIFAGNPAASVPPLGVGLGTAAGNVASSVAARTKIARDS